ncbi:MAG: bifunctional phosphoribosylaminoimidazolecarboxamide formyltransferase/IMP cyclohydrolase [Bacteroidota bacterium]
MEQVKQIQGALISVYHKEGLDEIARHLMDLGIKIYSTGGTARYLQDLGAEVHLVEDLTGYPSILGGRVKTLHPKVHGGILARQSQQEDIDTLHQYEIPIIDLVIVDLYPFEETVASGADEASIIEKIDIGGIALIRGAAKNFQDVVCIPSKAYYQDLVNILDEQKGQTSLEDRKRLAGAAFGVSSHYDTHIHAFFAPESTALKLSMPEGKVLRYGENPHQKGTYYGDLEGEFIQLNGKPLSYNNLVDIDGALQLVDEFTEPFFAIIKHTNPCGCATGSDLKEAWHRALEGDPISAFGGVLACNGTIDGSLAKEINKLFFEVLVAEDFTEEAITVLQEKKKRIVLKRNTPKTVRKILKSAVGGYLVQDKDNVKITQDNLTVKTSRQPTETEIQDIIFGDTVGKHLKSNAIAIVKNGQLIGSGIGQTSRIDALKQAIQKAEARSFDLTGAVLASDAFFPFSDSVEMAHQKGIEVVVEPGGSVRDEDSINFCESHGMCLIFTGIRHFKH